MIWLSYTILSAVAVAFCGILSKKALFTTHSTSFAVTQKFFEILILLFFIPFIPFNYSFATYLTIIFIALIGAFAYILDVKSFRHVEISVSAPLSNITPIFVLFLAFIFLGERLTYPQLIGVLILLSGTFMLEYKLFQKSFSLKSFFTQKYHLFLVISFLLYAITATIEKKLIVTVNPTSYLVLVWFFVFFFIGIYQMISFGTIPLRKTIKENGFLIFASSAFAVFAGFMYLHALSLALVSLVIPVKRLSTLIETIAGGRMFHEHHVATRSIACIVMIIGILFLSL